MLIHSILLLLAIIICVISDFKKNSIKNFKKNLRNLFEENFYKLVNEMRCL